MKKIGVFLFLALALASCVSASKYDELEAKYNATVISRDSLQKVVDRLNKEVSGLIADTTSMGTTLRIRQSQIISANRQIADLKEEIKSLTDNYDQLKSNSSEENQKLIAKLQKMQSDLTARENRLREVEQKLRSRDSTMQALRQKLADALLGFKDKGLSVSIKNGKVYVSLSNQLLFASGSTVIDKSGKSALMELANVLNTQPDINVLVEGHTDDARVVNLGAIKDNWDLSVLRSTEVVRYITVEGGVDPHRIVASGRSEYFPIEAGSTSDVRAKNRRTEIILTPKLDELFDIIK